MSNRINICTKRQVCPHEVLISIVWINIPRNIHRLPRNSVELMLVSLKLIFIHSMATSQKSSHSLVSNVKVCEKGLVTLHVRFKKTTTHTLYLSWHKPRQYPSCLVYRSCHLHHFKFKCQNMNFEQWNITKPFNCNRMSFQYSLLSSYRCVTRTTPNCIPIY